MAHPIHGVVLRTDSQLTLREQQILALRTKLQPGQFFTRRTAALLHTIPTSTLPQSAAIELGAIRPSRPLRRPQVIGHQIRPDTLQELPGAPNWLPTIADTWCLFAQVATKAELLAAGDYIVSGPSRYEKPLATIAELQDSTTRFERSKGSQLRRLILPLIRSGVESPMESHLRLVIVTAGLQEPVTCCPVTVRGRTLHSDLGYPHLKIAMEYQGAYHLGEDSIEQARKDIARVRLMEAAGWKVIQATVHDLRTPTAFLADLRAAISARSRG